MTAPTIHGIAEVIDRQRRAEEGLERARREYEQRRKNLIQEIEEAKRLRRLYSAGLDIEKVALAEKTLEVWGDCNSEIRRQAVEDAIRDVAAGGAKLHERYIGVKTYAHFGAYFGDQRQDCEYGFAPSHGTIVFRIGLPHVYLVNQSGIESGTIFDLDARRDACIYYLEALKECRVRGRGRF